MDFACTTISCYLHSQRYPHPTHLTLIPFFCEIFVWFIPPSLPCIGFFLMILDAFSGVTLVFLPLECIPNPPTIACTTTRLLALCTDVHRHRHQTKTKKHGYRRLALDLYIHAPSSHSSPFFYPLYPTFLASAYPTRTFVIAFVTLIYYMTSNRRRWPFVGFATLGFSICISVYIQYRRAWGFCLIALLLSLGRKAVVEVYVVN